MAEREEDMREVGSNPHVGMMKEGAIRVRTENSNEPYTLGPEDYYLGSLGVVINVAARTKMLIPWGRIVNIETAHRSQKLGDEE